MGVLLPLLPLLFLFLDCDIAVPSNETPPLPVRSKTTVGVWKVLAVRVPSLPRAFLVLSTWLLLEVEGVRGPLERCKHQHQGGQTSLIQPPWQQHPPPHRRRQLLQ